MVMDQFAGMLKLMEPLESTARGPALGMRALLEDKFQDQWRTPGMLLREGKSQGQVQPKFQPCQ